MSFQGKKGGGNNPFAHGGQPPPSGGGQYNAPPRGNPNAGRGGGNPFATKPANTPAQAQQYQPNYQSKNNASQWNAQQSQKPQAGKQSVNFGGASAKTNSNPFAQQGNSGGFGSNYGGMEMDSFSSGTAQQTATKFHNQNNSGTVKSNPFAPSAQQANASSSIFGASSNTAMTGQSFGGGNKFQQSAPAVKSNPFFAGGASQQQQPQQFGQGIFNANTNVNQFQQQPQQSQFSSGFQSHGFQHGAARPAAPVRAEVSAQALNAVNMSAALAPSQVQEIDLGLGLAAGPLHDAGVAGPTPSGLLNSPFPPAAPANADKTAAVVSGGDSSSNQEVAKMIALLDGILASSPLQGLSEEAPSERDVHELLQGGALVAGRVPAAPPARCSAQQHTQSAAAVASSIRPGQQANPFSNAAGGAIKPNSIFGIKQ